MASRIEVSFTFYPEDDELDGENVTGLTEDAYHNLLMTLDHRFGAQDIEVWAREG